MFTFVICLALVFGIVLLAYVMITGRKGSHDDSVRRRLFERSHQNVRHALNKANDQILYGLMEVVSAQTLLDAVVEGSSDVERGRQMSTDLDAYRKSLQKHRESLLDRIAALYPKLRLPRTVKLAHNDQEDDEIDYESVLDYKQPVLARQV